MKLEVPNARIMKGEASTLSLSASKLLLILIACQDQQSSQIRWSQEALSEITKLTRSTYYRSLKELTQGNWIQKKNKCLKVSLVGQNAPETEKSLTAVGQNVPNEIKKVSPVGQNAPETEKSLTAVGQNVPTAVRPDLIDLDLRSDQIGLREINSIAEFYHLCENEIDQLIETCTGKSKAGLMMIFESMKRKEISNPLKYLKKSIYNLNGIVTIQKRSPSFFEMYPDFVEPIKSIWTQHN